MRVNVTLIRKHSQAVLALVALSLASGVAIAETHSNLQAVSSLGTSAWFFFLINLFKVPFSAGLGLITWASLTLNAILLPGILLGAWLGVRFAKRMPEKVFANVAQVLAAAAALKLLFG